MCSTSDREAKVPSEQVSLDIVFERRTRLLEVLPDFPAAIFIRGDCGLLMQDIPYPMGLKILLRPRAQIEF